ncbi:DUF2997 domain-containing protein [Thermodesulfobacteriota bacterium]
MKEIVLDVSDDGEIRIETKGFTGKSCIQESWFLKEVLGKEIIRQLTPTYWQEEKTSVKKYLPLCG